jgi:hypothetical protein
MSRWQLLYEAGVERGGDEGNLRAGEAEAAQSNRKLTWDHRAVWLDGTNQE